MGVTSPIAKIIKLEWFFSDRFFYNLEFNLLVCGLYNINDPALENNGF